MEILNTPPGKMQTDRQTDRHAQTRIQFCMCIGGFLGCCHVQNSFLMAWFSVLFSKGIHQYWKIDFPPQIPLKNVLFKALPYNFPERFQAFHLFYFYHNQQFQKPLQMSLKHLISREFFDFFLLGEHCRHWGYAFLGIPYYNFMRS